MVGVGARVGCVVLFLVSERLSLLLRGEWQVCHVVVVAVEDALLPAEQVDIVVPRRIVCPRTVCIGHDGEDEAILVVGIGIEVHMAGATVEEVAGDDVCGPLAQHLMQSLLHLVGCQCGLVLMMQRTDVLPIPYYRSERVLVDGIDSVGRDDRSCTVNETVAALPQHLGHVVGNVHLPVQKRGYGVVVCAAVARVDEVEHGQTVLLAIVKADGSAVAIPDRVSPPVEKAQAVVAQVHATERLVYQGRVGLLLQTHPGFGTALLYAVHQMEEHLAVGCCRVHPGHTRPEALNLPFAIYFMVILTITGHYGFCVPFVIVLVTRHQTIVVGGDDDGLHLFPLTGKPYTVGERLSLGWCFRREK